MKRFAGVFLPWRAAVACWPNLWRLRLAPLLHLPKPIADPQSSGDPKGSSRDGNPGRRKQARCARCSTCSRHKAGASTSAGGACACRPPQPMQPTPREPQRPLEPSQPAGRMRSCLRSSDSGSCGVCSPGCGCAAAPAAAPAGRSLLPTFCDAELHPSPPLSPVPQASVRPCALALQHRGRLSGWPVAAAGVAARGGRRLRAPHNGSRWTCAQWLENR